MTSSDLVTAIVVFVIFGSVTSLIAYGLTLSVRYRRRVLQNQERMAALEKGTPLPELIEEQMAPWSGRIYLLRGMMWLFSGVAIVVFLSVMAAYSRQNPGMESRLYRAQELRRLGATDDADPGGGEGTVSPAARRRGVSGIGADRNRLGLPDLLQGGGKTIAPGRPRLGIELVRISHDPPGGVAHAPTRAVSRLSRHQPRIPT